MYKEFVLEHDLMGNETLFDSWQGTIAKGEAPPLQSR